MIELRVEGMTCGHCVSAVTRAVKEVDPEAEVRVDLAAGTVRVEGASSAGAVSKAIAEAGYPAAAAVGPAPAATRSKGGCCGG